MCLKNVTSSNKVIDQNQNAEKKVYKKLANMLEFLNQQLKKTIVNIPTFIKAEQSVKTNVSRNGKIVKPNPKYGD